MCIWGVLICASLAASQSLGRPHDNCRTSRNYMWDCWCANGRYICRVGVSPSCCLLCTCMGRVAGAHVVTFKQHVRTECALPGEVWGDRLCCAGMLCCAVLCCSADDLQQAILKVGPMLEDANAAAVAAGHQSAAADARVRIRAGLLGCRRGLGRATAGVLGHISPVKDQKGCVCCGSFQVQGGI